MFVYYKCYITIELMLSEGIDVNKTSELKECDICHCWFFLNKGFKFKINVCNRCHALLLMFINFSDISIWNIKGADYHCIISGINKSELITLICALFSCYLRFEIRSFAFLPTTFSIIFWRAFLVFDKSVSAIKEVNFNRHGYVALYKIPKFHLIS